MNGIYLQRMLENLPSGSLPPNWQGFDLEHFSRDKTLWDYQQQALEYALKALWKYYSPPGLTVPERKQASYAWYKDFGLQADGRDLDIPLDLSSAARRRVTRLLESYYSSIEGRLPYEQFINRMAFWMATGSGKTLVIVKLIELLHELMRRGEMPANDILILAHRDDLLEQLQAHVDEFNSFGDLTIRLHELRDYSEVKRAQPNIFSATERNIFFYRSDNLSDEQKEKIIDFRSYDNNGGWYILLDEAHKGDREDSKRQHIYSILSRNGFLFNFSATFTDPRDIICTAFNFNLSEFIRKGFGKHIYIFSQETVAFKRKSDYTESEKQKIVLKALIMLSLIRKVEKQVRAVDASLYHRPLLMTLVNSVNTKEADLKLFFRELVRIGKGQIKDTQWLSAKEELRKELAARPAYLYEPDWQVRMDDTMLANLTQDDLLQEVFNAAAIGEIEVLIRPSDRKEIAFKLKTSEEAFALIRIGDISEWLTRELSGYEINTHFNDESFFERLNHPSSDINILLGSRSFYEGWDSNRPNVIMYINIGTGLDAKKFILQSVGRGVRIEPLPNQRKRFRALYASGTLSEADESIFHQVKGDTLPLESEFIFGTNRDALETVISELDQEDKQIGGQQISLDVNEERVAGKLLLVPVYRQQASPLSQKRNLAKFSLSEQNLALLESYLDYLHDDRLLLAQHDARPDQIHALRESMSAPRERFRTDGPSYKNMGVLMHQVIQFMSLHGKEFNKFKPLEDEINHFRHVRVLLEEVDFIRFEKQLLAFHTQPKKISDLKAQFAAGQMSLDDLMAQTQQLGNLEQFTHLGQTVLFKRITQHYYLPMLISEDEKLDYIRTIIKVRSEVDFLKKLELYLGEPENRFKRFDWWLFSRIDETYDAVTVPYYNPFENKVSNFKPDFIFWLQKGEDYHIIFVDPKGTSRTEYEHKVDGFRNLFEMNEEPVDFKHAGLKVQVHLFLFTQDRAFAADHYRRYWLDSVEKMLSNISDD